MRNEGLIMVDEIKRRLYQAIEAQKKINEKDILLISKIAQLITDTFKRGKKIVLFGNGGSAAQAQHIAAELIGKFKKKRRALPAIALTTNTSVITAIGNDYTFDDVFARQVEGLVRKGDIVVGLSTSGNSPNVVKALRVSRKREAITVGFTGKNGGRMKRLCNIYFRAPSMKTARIQEIHIMVWHIICELVERNFS